MGFVHICVGFVITLAIMVVTFLFCMFVAWANSDNGGTDLNEAVFFAWFFSSVGFGICLTILLFQNGVI